MATIHGELNSASTLLDFFDKHFGPKVLDCYDDGNLGYFRRGSIGTFRKYLGREPLLSDLTREAHDGFYRWFAEQGRSETVRMVTLARLRRIWREAFRLGLVATDRPEAPPGHRLVGDRQARPKKDPWKAARLIDKADCKTCREFFFHWYEPLRLRGKSRRTVHQYEVQFGAFERFLEREPMLSDLNDETLSALLTHLVELGKHPATANKARSHLRALAGLAFRKKFLDVDPEVAAMREPRRIPDAWTREQLGRLWAAARVTPGEVCGVSAGEWWLALLEVFWWTGERLSAVLATEWPDIDLDSGWLVVRAETRKFGLADKETELPPSAVAALRAIQLPTRTLVFELPGSDQYKLAWLYDHYREILERAGLPTGRRDMFHKLRRSAASHYEALGGDATKLLGHSARRVTERYLDPRIAKPPQSAALLFQVG